MDANGFDTLTKAVSRYGMRRRQVLGSALAGAAVLLGVAQLPVVAEKKGVHSEGPCGNGSVKANRCKRNGQCCTGYCDKGKGKQADGHCRCKKAGQSCNEDRNCCATPGQPMTCQGYVCVSPDPGPEPDPCTGLKPTGTSSTQGLQEAIDAAKRGDTLTLCAGTWRLTKTVTISKTLTLIGAGAGQTILDGGNAVGVINVDRDPDATLQDLTITKGKAQIGAGIYSWGNLMLLGVSVSGNTASSQGGGIFVDRGLATLDEGSRVSGNTARSGGGIYINYGSSLALKDGSVVGGTGGEGNAASSNGGGIFNFGGHATLEEESRVTGNTAVSQGGGIYNGEFQHVSYLYTGSVTLEGEDPSPIVVSNCQDNCGGPIEVAKCAATPISCS